MKKILFIGLFTCLFSIKSSAQESVKWYSDVKEAVDIAMNEDKKVLLFFTGSDWCGWCKRLQKEVFSTKDFKKWSNDLVLVELDFPRRKQQAQNIRMQNLQLQNIFKVRGYPTIHFVVPEKTTDGRINLKSLGKTGYVRGGADAWLNVANNIVNKPL